MAAPTVCPRCDSSLLQPLRSRPCPDGEVMVELRCPECFIWMQQAVSAAECAELDREQAQCRRKLVEAYERCVTDTMESLAYCLGMALDLDLVGADDFAPRRIRHTPAPDARALP